MPSDSASPGKGRKYTLVERERRFLLAGLPAEPSIRVLAITDHYLVGTRLRLRLSSPVTDHDEEVRYKLTQKIPVPGSGSRLITTIYLNEEEYQALAVLPAAVLNKTRHSVPPYGVDVFHGDLSGLFMAEVEFQTDEEMAGFSPAPFVIAEVTGDHRFTGGHLVTVNRRELADALPGYGLHLPI
ncbi:MAG TPA: hypothetical protein VFN61_14975 [Acidimicrobiales bacterium]|nr:hypothetical protein [Acidimicrobiales bacterium]